MQSNLDPPCKGNFFPVGEGGPFLNFSAEQVITPLVTKASIWSLKQNTTPIKYGVLSNWLCSLHVSNLHAALKVRLTASRLSRVLSVQVSRHPT